jgi:hypothetical protein
MRVRGAGAAHELGGDLARLERAGGRDLKAHEELELGPRVAGGCAQPFFELGLDDAGDLVDVHHR